MTWPRRWRRSANAPRRSSWPRFFRNNRRRKIRRMLSRTPRKLLTRPRRWPRRRVRLRSKEILRRLRPS